MYPKDYSKILKGSPQDRGEAIDRIRRQGQPKTCHDHRFYCKKTVEEDRLKRRESS